MHGAGTKRATTTNKAARLLDLTRLTSRAGRTLTGVDRVERAYLCALLNSDVPCFGLIRTRLGYILLGREGMTFLREASANGNLSENILGDLRTLAIARVPKVFLGFALRRHLPRGTVYVNTGHSNLTARVVQAVRTVPDVRIAVLIHDTIPLDFPQYQAAGAPERFAGFLARACGQADLLIYNSYQTEQDVRRNFSGALPEEIVAHLGIDFADPAPQDLPRGLPPKGPYFVTVGTIEPRKGHDLLLDLWGNLAAELGPDTPPLLICGGRGWNNQAVFDRLDALGPDAPIRELSGLSDGAISELLRGATALLFPSQAEGFGLPPAEAARHITPIVCNDLPIYREFLGNIPVYAPSGDAKLWYQTVMNAYRNAHSTRNAPSSEAKLWKPPTWEAHFELVLRVI
ncbi:glycosyltransferase family 4 protein [Donghicola sp. C2-DW-16]|uniref:Glycosyltransferase family 4 protein n=2 Tax=Donghicola mangrovi TaxID=2729614 RepID=A0ABX2P9R4_9RHOB|nr:glycosyltransferase family 4 protein [Donghicola mangrovi]